MQQIASPQIRELDQRDINSVLARNLFGRLAWLRDGRIDVLPIRYVYADGSIYGRTTAGGKLLAMNPHGTPVAFEVDEVQSTRQWRSVLVHGTFVVAEPEMGREEYLRALGTVRRMDHLALRDEDPTPERRALFRILIQDATGRAMG
jgi:uncharacterized protein